jgi:glycosyltransferase involved in cell wall biosynthesis
MKVVHVELGRFMYGGAQQVRYLLDGLAERGGENVLICEKSSEIVQLYQNPRVRVRPVSLSILDETDIFACWQIARIVREEKPDLVHVHSRRGNFPAVVGGRLAGAKCLMSHRIDSPLPCSFDIRCKFPLYKRIIAISDGIAEALHNIGVPEIRNGDEFIVVVKSAVDAERFRPKPDRAWFDKEFSLSGKGIIIGVNASLIPRKGHRVLLDAMPAVLKKHPDVQVLFFGKGRMEAELRKAIADNGLGRNVHLAGYRGDVERILPNFDLLVHPALREGLGVAILEAAACGLPVVASRAGGIPEVVHDGINGLLCDPGDSDAFAAAINRLLDNPGQMRAFGAASREMVVKDFSIARMVEGNWRVYEQILDINQPNLRKMQ